MSNQPTITGFQACLCKNILKVIQGLLADETTGASVNNIKQLTKVPSLSFPDAPKSTAAYDELFAKTITLVKLPRGFQILK